MTDTIARLSPVRSSRQLVAMVYAAMVTVALGIAVVDFKLDYDKTRSDMEERARAYAVSMATDVRWYVDVARQTLQRAAEQLNGAPDDDASNVLSQALSELPEGVVTVVYDAAGNSRALIGYEAGPVNISDRHYFQELRDGKDWVISNLIVDRVTGAKTFAVGLALHGGGRFTGAAVAYAPMQVFSEAWLSVGGRDSNAFLVHEEGWITARLPPVDSIVYDEPVSSDFVDSFSGENGSYWAAASPIDGIARVLGYARVPSAPLVAVIGLSPDEQMQQFWGRVAVTLLILTPILILLGLATWRIRRLITEQEAIADQLAHSLRRNEDLLLEIHHRVKNNLQSVLSLVRTQVKDRASIEAIEPRISAMAAVHEHIYRHGEFVEARAAKYITEIAQKVLYATSNNLELQTDIADIELPADIVMPVGQLVNEAIINAVKYGYPDGRRGTIRIRLGLDTPGMATLTIRNDGAPLSGNPEQGIGSRLMRAFGAQMRGTVETTSDDGGVTVTARFPIEGR